MCLKISNAFQCRGGAIWDSRPTFFLLAPSLQPPMGQSASFTNQHVVITGGSQGFGLHLAAEFAKDGARVTDERWADFCLLLVAQIQLFRNCVGGTFFRNFSIRFGDVNRIRPHVVLGLLDKFDIRIPFFFCLHSDAAESQLISLQMVAWSLQTIAGT